MNCKTHKEKFGYHRIIKNPRGLTRELRICKKCRDLENCLLVQN